MKEVAILSGDLINSSKYPKGVLLEVIAAIKTVFSSLETQYPKSGISFSIYRGDSFQGVTEQPELALTVALQLKAAVNMYTAEKHSTKAKTPVADLRIAIGIGEAEYQKGSLAESNGPAFQYSGRTLDAMKAEGVKMALTTAYPEINDEFKVSLKLLDSITNRWSTASAEVVFYLLKGLTEQQIANELDRSQAAIHLRKKAAGWEEIQLLLQRYQQITKKYFS
ncbi:MULTISPECIES: hypothetical protein [Altibacter]|uniref:hypothetical protein n=1 Tax=Altibacter TaxID=1535231 RepID=UPI00054D5FD9|nr:MULTISPECIES: hypothetical protein [Altibacter]MCW9038426.1 hypothetical protein [Altibacter sp.]